MLLLVGVSDRPYVFPRSRSDRLALVLLKAVTTLLSRQHFRSFISNDHLYRINNARKVPKGTDTFYIP